MDKILFCKRCLYGSDHPLGITIDSEGICSGCRVHEEKDTLDWDERLEKLKSIVNPYRIKDGSNYDCIVPVTGGNDSYFIIYIVKEVLGLNPLLVTYNKYFNTPLGIRNLANLRIQFNCDILYQNVNPVSVKKITRSTLRRFGSIYWPILAGQTVFPVQTAVRYKVPLVIWGAHQGMEQVGMFSHLHEVEMTRRYRKEHDLMGHEADDLVTIFDSINEKDIFQYRYPDDAKLREIGVRGLYLGNYVRWDPKAQHEKMIKNYGYLSAKFSRTFDCYDYVDCFNYMDLHDYFKLLKHGYSKVTDHACREIRHGRLSRSHGAELVRRYEQKPFQFPHLFLDWLGMTESSMKFVFDQYRNPSYWSKEGHNEWTLHGWSDLREDKKSIDPLEVDDSNSFIALETLKFNRDESYITIGKGWP